MVARTRRARGLPGVLCVVAVSASVHRAHADETAPITLAWLAPAGCPDETVLRARIDQLRGEQGTAPHAAPLDVRAFVTLLPDAHFRARLELVQGGSERSRVLEAPTCSDLAEASAAVIALAIAPEAQSADGPLPMPPLEAPATSPSARGPLSVAAPADDGATRRPAPPHGAMPWRVDASAGAAVDFGATASVALGATLLGRLRVGRFLSFALRGSFFPPHASTVPLEPTQGVDILLAAAAPLACVSPLDLPFELDTCAEFEAGYLHARGFGPPLHYEKGAPWFAPGAGLSAAFPKRGRVRSRLSADALFPLNHTEFRLTNVGVPHQLPVVAPRVGLYLELAFP
jgi:hypothetical protein